MKRVMVLGCAGAGKTTWAKALGEITALPVFHMDQIHYQPGWVVREKSEKIELAHKVEAAERWIFEGGLSATYANRAARADTAIWLDLPLLVRAARILKRWYRHRGQTRPEMPDNCPERLDPAFTKWVLTTTTPVRAKIARAIADAPHLSVHHVRSAEGADTLLDWLRDDHNAQN